MRPNRLRQLLDQDRPSIGTHVQITWPAVVEIIGQTGMYDYVELVGEYAPYDLYSLENFGRAVDLFDDFSAMFKVDQEPRAYLAQRAMGCGIQNLLFADVRSAEDARQCVRIVRAETPETGGIHGASMRRSVGYLLEPGSPAFVKSTVDAVVALMIEKKGAMDELEAILAVKGVDMVQFGPTDYSMSIGRPGQGSSPEVWEAQVRMIKKALEMGVAPRAEIGSVEQAKRFLDLGVKHFCIGTDLVILSQWWKKSGDDLRKLVETA
ncbi:MAG: 2,4-dihydroxyhept-2-ene-1,7-dioic acid aldolase [Anaerolineae bacterium]|nr:2,4-dihydroxyhept-2-ene-1,7-dioic acid aldolase [Anaerolineae bacterium]